MPYVFALFLLFASVSQVLAQTDSGAGGPSSIKGDVLYWEENELVVKEMSGREVRLRVTPETKIEGVVVKLKTGDKIVAQLKPDGSAATITLQIPDSGAAPGPPAMR
jgi:hypothetical protein